MCITDPACPSSGKGLAQICQSCGKLNVALHVFFLFFKRQAALLHLLDEDLRIQNFWGSDIDIPFSWLVILFKGIFVTRYLFKHLPVSPSATTLT